MKKTVFEGIEPGLSRALMEGYEAITGGTESPADLESEIAKIREAIRSYPVMKDIYRMLKDRGNPVVVDTTCEGDLAGLQARLYISDGTGKVTFYPKGSRGALHYGAPTLSIPVDMYMSAPREAVRAGTNRPRSVGKLYLETGKDITGKPVPVLQFRESLVDNLWMDAWNYPGENMNGLPCLESEIRSVLSGENSAEKT